MIGVPRYLNTREDYEYAHRLALEGQISPADMRQFWEGLLAGAYCYRFDRNLADGEPADGPAPDYIVLEVQQPDGTVVRRQEKRVRDTSSRMDRLGYTEAEVQVKIAELWG